jgi:hypothetical protein
VIHYPDSTSRKPEANQTKRLRLFAVIGYGHSHNRIRPLWIDRVPISEVSTVDDGPRDLLDAAVREQLDTHGRLLSRWRDRPGCFWWCGSAADPGHRDDR